MQIIQKNPAEVESDWQKEIASAFKNPSQLLDYLQINPDEFADSFDAKKLFPMMVPRFFADLMQLRDPNDPLLRQVLPLKDEFLSVTGFTRDPLGEKETSTQGLVHKYKNRVLLILKTGCAVNCRYCFRRHFPYQEHHLNRTSLVSAFDTIANDGNIDEVILSGGDPLMANDQTIQFVVSSIEKIPHIKRLRIHSRLPVVIPSRVTGSLLNILERSRLTVNVVLHVNHANEVSLQLKDKCKRLTAHGVRLFNQAVMLRGVNDCASNQMQLNEMLFDAGIQPYYLHMFDKVDGAAHFFVEDKEAKQIMRDVVANQSGYMVPKLVREEPGKPSKTLIDIYSD